MDASGGSPSRRFLTPRRLIFAAIVAAAGLAFVVVWFQPQKLIQDARVNEPPPGTMAQEDDAMMEGDAMTLSGDFRSIDHETSGTATVALADDGHYYVRLEDFSTENGPDLFVYLSTAPASADGREYADEFIDLGSLKGNIGDQNYVVPDGTDLEKYKSVVIWCRRFTAAFGSAPLSQS